MNIREPGHYHLVRRARARQGRRSKLKRTGKAFIIVLIVAALLVFGLYIRPVPAVTAETLKPTTATKTVPLTWPKSGEAAVGVEGEGVLATSGQQDARPIASVAKVMLALAVLKKKPLVSGETGPTLTITQADVNLYNSYAAQQGSGVKVEVGEQMNEYQALQATLLPSANNAADMLAIWAYGSMSAYHEAANELATSLGMKHSHFGGDASGFSPDTVSTPEDLVLLGQAALKNPVLKEIVGQQTADLPVVGTVRNVNWLLGTYGIIGIKTGNTDAAGGCFLAAATRKLANGQSVTVISAIIASPSLQESMTSSVALINSVYAGYGEVTVVHKGDILVRYRVPWQGTVVATANKDVKVFVWLGSSSTAAVVARALNAPQPVGLVVGKVSVKGQNSNIVLDTAIKPAPFSWRIWRH